jgi:hypothetical protein
MKELVDAEFIPERSVALLSRAQLASEISLLPSIQQPRDSLAIAIVIALRLP